MANNNNNHHYHGVVQLTVIFLVTTLCTGGYLITTPRQWVSGEAVQICVFTVNSPTATHNNNNNNNNTITVSLEETKNRDDDDVDVVRSPIIPPRVINIPPDKSEHCDKLTLPTLRLTKAKLRVTGHVGGQRVKHHKKVKLAGRVTKTFVQTDKQLYKPGQDVQFRILTLTGPYLKLSTNQYPLVWVETPTGSRIAQWINVDNTPGLIHMAFTLSEEPEQGDYKIHVDSPVDGGSSVSQTFSVKEYTLPRFEVTITPPKLLFGNDQEFTVTVCANVYENEVEGWSGESEVEGWSGEICEVEGWSGKICEVEGWSGESVVEGWSGESVVEGWSGESVVEGWSGESEVDGWSGESEVEGWSGESEVEGWSGESEVEGWSGESEVEGWSGESEVDGWSGESEVEGWSGESEVDGWSGESEVEGWSGESEVEGWSGESEVEGWSGESEVEGWSGESEVEGWSGESEVEGWSGEICEVEGWSGESEVEGWSGESEVEGWSGESEVEGWSGESEVEGWSGESEVEGWSGESEVEGWSGESEVEGWSGESEVEGWSGESEVEGWSGESEVEGWSGEICEVEGWSGESEVEGWSGESEVEGWSGEICEYTYGQPVKGNVSLDLNNGGWGSSRKSHLVEGQISGCRDFPITADDVAMNGQHYHSQSLSVKAKVSEDGTGEAFEEISSIPIHRTRFNFKMVADEKFVKPGLPYTGKVKVELPDGSPAVGETLKVCAAGNCKNITTDSITGILTFVVPQYEDLTIRIESIDEDGSASTGGSWRRIMHSSQFHRTVKRYFSPSRSSLIIHAPTTTLPCLQGESYTHNLPLLYSITNQNSVNITVQVVSRGQIQFSSSEHHDLTTTTTTTTPLPLHGTLLSPLTPVAADTVQGSLTLPLTLPPNASPTAKVIVWLTRSDGEVVSDARQLKVDTCYTNPVTVAWSTSKSQPGDEVDVSITSHPQSICSLGVVDKSVELLSSTSDPLTVSQVFGMVEQTMVPSHVNPQVDDNKYCKKMLRNPTTPSPVPEDTSEPDPFFFRPRPYYYPMDYYTEYVDALKMFDDSGLFVFSDLTVETRPCKERERVMWVALSAPADFVFERRQEGALPGPGSEVMELPPGNMISHDYDMVPDESSSVSSPQPRTYFPETWLWQLSVLPNILYSTIRTSLWITAQKASSNAGAGESGSVSGSTTRQYNFS
ncbi:hypothetical protein Pmani_018528 [Petrolisthes manimaculis]|uniref:TEP1-F n=1 Tax=Petrolisthes manimaculis TaxID=1843537 RepID=A0AAE1PLC7_9EUCA|nr:hypothetical protein Pmani_018528 [Petrolisthes manimaculis]